MDIRSFFGKAGSVKKPADTGKPKATPAKKPTETEKTESTPAKKTAETGKSKTPSANKQTEAEKKQKDNKLEKITPKKDKSFTRNDDDSPDHSITSRKEKSSSTKKTKSNSKRNKSKDKQTKRIARKPESDDEVEIIDEDSDFETNIKSKKNDQSNKDSLKRSKSKDKKDKNGNLKEAESSPEIKAKSNSNKGNSKKNVLISSDEDLEEEEVIAPKSKKRSQKPKRGVIFESESEDEDPLPKKARKPRSKKRRHFSDSDDEKQMSIMDAFQHSSSKSSKPTPKPKEVTPAKAPSPKKQISAADFFGTSSVQRTERKTPTGKRKAEPSPVKNGIQDDMEIHDDDFEETLRQLDEDTGHKNKKPKLEDPPPPKSLAAKLSQKAKQEEFRVADTPEKTIAKSGSTTSPKSPGKATPGKAMPKNSPEKKTPPKSEPVKSPKKTSPQSKNSPDKPELQKKNTGYRSYLGREGPRALGSKEIPQGAENCLEGLTFVITGILESMERDEAKTLAERYGGKVTGSLSKKTSYIVIGRDAGESKLSKANQFGTKQIDEDGLLDLVKTLPGKKSKYQVAAEKEAVKWTPGKKTSQNTSSATPNSKLKPQSSMTGSLTPKSLPGTPKMMDSPASSVGASPQPTSAVGSGSGECLLWVDKYKPTSLKQIIGQQGDKSNAKKLLNWLRQWHKFVSSGKKPTFNRFSDDGAGFRAALLSGPPGVGKTTTAQLVCQEAEFSFVELNASDTRSKKSLQQEVSESLNNHTLSDFIGGSSSKSSDGKRHCLIMDEIDGMAGNEDRGGIQEMITLIKNTKIPIICMCNDRNHQKMRTLSNYCFDLRFQRPRVEQIKAAMMSMSYKEGIKIPPPALNEMILASNQDIRQVIHNLSMWSSNDKNLTYDQVKADAAKAQKDMKLGPFDVVRKVFSAGEETANMTLNDKSDLFFHDYSFGPLFVQENYITVHPYEARGDVKKHLQLLSQAADSIAAGDLVDRKVRGQGSWNLLPLQAIFASVIPGNTMRGGLGGQIQFPSWLGKNSTTNKNDRILQELKSHMRLKVSADKKGLNMGYLPHLRHSLTRPLVEKGADGIEEIISQLDEYNLLKEDLDSLLEVSQWPNSKDNMGQVESKVKAAFTRAYNKEVHMTPYATGSIAKKGRKRGGDDGPTDGLEGEEGGGNGGVSEEEEEEDLTADSMIKKKKSTAKAKGGAAKGKKAGEGSKTNKAAGKGGQSKGRGKTK